MYFMAVTIWKSEVEDIFVKYKYQRISTDNSISSVDMHFV